MYPNSMRIITLFATFLVALTPATARAQKPANPQAVIETNVGRITIELLKDRAPATVDNFVRYATSNFYNGTIFHRVVKGFMIQGGGFTPQMRLKKAGPPIRNEASAL